MKLFKKFENKMGEIAKPHTGWNPYVLVILSFVFVILLGSILLYMPFSAASDSKISWDNWGDWGYYLDCFFVAVSATCVTGLNTFTNGLIGTFNITGQIVVMAMIQIGGLGFITVLTFLLTLFRSRLQFKNRYILAQAVNSTNIADVVKFVRKVILISAIAETTGFLLGLPVYLNMFPGETGKALWVSLFTSVSAFNNAGFDLFGSTSLLSEPVQALPTGLYYYLISYLMIMIIAGGLSFLVYIDVFDPNRKYRNYRPFTKVVLVTTVTLLLSGFAIFVLTDVIPGNIRVSDALFQSVTLRTAGFSTIDQAQLSLPGKAVSCVLMFIGGSPLSTAGGIKTTTAFIIFLSMYCHLRGKPVVAFRRTYSSNMILKAMSLMLIGLFVTIFAMVCIAGIESGNKIATMENVFLEVFSGFGTVGVSANLTPTLQPWSKIILCILMFTGRLGPITFFQVFQANLGKTNKGHFDYIEEDILVG